MFIKKEPLIKERIRKIESGFGFIPTRFLTDGYFLSLSQYEKLIYFFLVIVSDRQGLSHYSQDKISTLLELSIDDYLEARNGLIEKSLIAFNGLIFQLLSLPDKPVVLNSLKNLSGREDFLKSDPLTIRQFLTSALNGEQAQEARK